MANNYIDTPVLILKVLAADTIHAGEFVKGGTTGGWQLATAAGAACGAVAVEDADASAYGSVMFIGIAMMSTADSVSAGEAVRWSDTNKVQALGDSGYLAIGTCLDGDSVATTRGTRILVYGTPTYKSVWT
jgi:hypothetical protein